MPAIQINLSGSYGVCLSIPTHKHVQVKLKGGDWGQAEFLGFICHAGAKMLGHTHFAKIKAVAVTNENFGMAREWRHLDVSGGEFVLGVRLARFAYEGLGDGTCVYALVDPEGWPIVMRDPVI